MRKTVSSVNILEVSDTIERFSSRVQRNSIDYTNPIAATNSFVSELLEKLDNRYFYYDKVDTFVQFGVGVMSYTALRAAQVFRDNDPERFFNALKDNRTMQHTLLPISRSPRAGVIEHDYSLSPAYAHVTPKHHLIHTEYDGDFFTLQPEHRDSPMLHEVSFCPYTKYIGTTTVALARRMHDLDIIESAFAHENAVV